MPFPLNWPSVRVCPVKASVSGAVCQSELAISSGRADAPVFDCENARTPTTINKTTAVRTPRFRLRCDFLMNDALCTLWLGGWVNLLPCLGLALELDFKENRHCRFYAPAGIKDSLEPF